MKRLLLAACALLTFAAPARAENYQEDDILTADTLGVVGDTLGYPRAASIIVRTGKCPDVRSFAQGIVEGDSVLYRIEGCSANPQASMHWTTIAADTLPDTGGDLKTLFHWALSDKIALKSATATSDSTLRVSRVYEYTRLTVFNNGHQARAFGIQGGVACVR